MEATEKRSSKGKIKRAKTIFETIGVFFSIKGLLTQILETQSVSNWIKPQFNCKQYDRVHRKSQWTCTKATRANLARSQGYEVNIQS